MLTKFCTEGVIVIGSAYFITLLDVAEIIKFFFVYIECILTPYHIMIQQSYEWKDGVTIFLFLGDIASFIRFVTMLRTYWRENRINQTDLLFQFLSFSVLWLNPLLAVFGMARYELVWCNIVRMACLRLLPKYFKKTVDVIERHSAQIDETSIRLAITFLAALFASTTAACLWFYVSCNDNNFSGSCISNQSSWVASDLLISIDSPASRFVRSLHFILATLMTIGSGTIFLIY